jgi:maltooligosyltrehalose trehalohydrolase
VNQQPTTDNRQPPRHGALLREDGVQFRVWAPHAENVTLLLEDAGETRSMSKGAEGYFEHVEPDLAAGARYRYRQAGGESLPDPASRFQPEGVHGPSQVVDPGAYDWRDDDWTGVAQKDLAFYELHVGAFTPEGTFRAAAERMEHLRELGVTAVEIMPVADFPGRWNWGYDQGALFAPSRAYGTPRDLRALIDCAHQLGLAVFLDVIYNHLGPDGAYVAAFAPMFTDRHETPWGQAINLDDARSEGVRRFFVDNALHWLREYHADGLRLDATHALIDDSDTHFLTELAEAVSAIESGPPRRLIAEDERNERRLLLPRADGGHGLDGVWVDDFHHQLRHITAGDAEGYFADFAGATAQDVAATLRQGWFFTGQRSSFLNAPRGTDPTGVRPAQCVYCIQNHDQVGNRPMGTRLSDDASPAAYRAATALLLFAEQLPLLFMGQEWAASTPFQFFTDHDDELGRQVSEGRREEFEDFAGFGGEVPDPQDEATFRRSTLNWQEREEGRHARTLALYRDLLSLRKRLEGEQAVEAHGDYGLTLRRGDRALLVVLKGAQVVPSPSGDVLLHTEQSEYVVDGQLPRLSGEEAYFERPGALVVSVY